MKKVRALLIVDERMTALTVWREAGALIRRDPVAMLLPAAFLGMLVEVPYLLPDSEYIVQGILAFLIQAFAFYFYVAYAEEIMIEARSAEHIPLRSVLTRFLHVAPAVPLVTIASVGVVIVPGTDASLLVIQ